MLETVQMSAERAVILGRWAQLLMEHNSCDPMSANTVHAVSHLFQIVHPCTSKQHPSCMMREGHALQVGHTKQ